MTTCILSNSVTSTVRKTAMIDVVSERDYDTLLYVMLVVVVMALLVLLRLSCFFCSSRAKRYADDEYEQEKLTAQS